MRKQTLKPKLCLRCGNRWKSKLERPKQCPHCKQTMWDTPARPKKFANRIGIKEAQDKLFDNMQQAILEGKLEREPAPPAKLKEITSEKVLADLW